MDKQAELSMEVLVITLLALIVLLVLIFIFKSQISELFGGFGKLIHATTSGGNP